MKQCKIALLPTPTPLPRPPAGMQSMHFAARAENSWNSSGDPILTHWFQELGFPEPKALIFARFFYLSFLTFKEAGACVGKEANWRSSRFLRHLLPAVNSGAQRERKIQLEWLVPSLLLVGMLRPPCSCPTLHLFLYPLGNKILHHPDPHHCSLN